MLIVNTHVDISKENTRRSCWMEVGQHKMQWPLYSRPLVESSVPRCFDAGEFLFGSSGFLSITIRLLFCDSFCLVQGLLKHDTAKDDMILELVDDRMKITQT